MAMCALKLQSLPSSCEEWKPIDGFEGKYWVSNQGNVSSDGGQTNLYTYVDHGYVYVKLWHEGRRKNYRVNRLVAIAFIPNPHGKPEVHHKDDDKLNNCDTNLAWATRRENLYSGNSWKASVERRRKNAGEIETGSNV